MKYYDQCSTEQLLNENGRLQIQYEDEPENRQTIVIAIQEVCAEILKRRRNNQ